MKLTKDPSLHDHISSPSLLSASAIRELSPSLTMQFRSITIVVTFIALRARGFPQGTH